MTDNLPTDESLSALTQLGQELYTAEEQVLLLEAQLKQAKKARDFIAQRSVPDVMSEMGLESLTMTGGRKIDIKEKLAVSPPVANRPLVLEALVEQGAGALIKTNVSVAFGRGSEAEVKELLDLLQEKGLAAKSESKVEPATLKKHVKDRLENGEPVDTELFGVWTGKEAKFTEGKPKPPVFEGE